jgi:hypothetical protein
MVQLFVWYDYAGSFTYSRVFQMYVGLFITKEQCDEILHYGETFSMSEFEGFPSIPIDDWGL